MAGFEQTEATQLAPAADSNSHLLGNIWSKVKSTASDAADGAARVGHKVVEAAPGVIRKGTDEAKSLATPHNIEIAKRAGEAGAKAAILGPHAAVIAAGASVYEQTTGHRVPLNPLNVRGEIAKRVIDGATSTATRPDAPPVSHPHKLTEKTIDNPFSQTDAPRGKPVSKPAEIAASGIFSGIKDTASKYLPHSPVVEGAEHAHMKR